MILTILLILTSLADNKWCISNLSKDDIGILIFISLIALADTLVTGLIIWFFIK